MTILSATANDGSCPAGIEPAPRHGQHSMRLGDVGLRLECTEPQQCLRIACLWRQFFAIQDFGSPHPNPALSFHFLRPGSSLAWPSFAEAADQTPGVRTWKTERGFYLECGDSALDIDLAASQSVGLLNEGFWQQPVQDQREFFLLSLLMLLQATGRYGLHANAVAHDETGLLIVGPSGSGKTTLAIGLIRQGWRYLADDALVLHRCGGGIEVLAIRRSFSCPPDLPARFPELRAAAAAGVPLSEGKTLVDLDSVYPGYFTSRCYPRVMLFPTIVAQRHSQLLPLGETRAMVALLEQSVAIASCRSAAREQMAALKQLVQQATCYQLLLGTDARDKPSIVPALLADVFGDAVLQEKQAC